MQPVASPFVASTPVSPSQRRAAAYHEAGHCVAAWRRNWTINHVTIIPDIDDDGLHRGGHISVSQNNHDLPGCLIFTLAGPAAQRKVAPRSKVRQAGSADIDAASRLARIHSLTPEAERSLLRFAEQEARALVNLSWVYVDEIAHALLAQDVLSGDQAAGILDGIQQKQTGAWQPGPHPTREALAAYECARALRSKTISRRDVADAVLDAVLRRTVTGEPLALDDPSMESEVVIRLGLRGFDADQSLAKYSNLISDQRQRMQWRRVSP